MQPTHDGTVEYIAIALVFLQILIARQYLGTWRRNWPRAAFAAMLVFLVLMWSAALIGLWFTWTGRLYSSQVMPVGPRTAIVAVGYIWILLSSVAAALAGAGRWIVSRIPATKYSAGRRRWMTVAGTAAIAAPAAAVSYGVFIERYQYGVRELDFPIAGLHPDLEGFTIAQVSDLHVSPFLSARQAGRAIDMANELQANLAVFTGDLISEIGDPLNPAIRELIRLRADYGVLGCMGNHESYVGCRNYLERQTRRAGMNFLRGTTTQIRRGAGILNIAGVDYQKRNDPAGYLPNAERLVMAGVPNLLLSHNPDVFPIAVRRGFQAVLGGHTHGGQINVEILHQDINPARFRTPFISGLYREGEASCFVTNGIGTIGIPVRLGAPPEIALLRLRRA